MIPDRFRSLFWDVSPKDFDPVSFPTYTIGRVIEYGDRESVAWLQEMFSQEQIAEVLRTERRLSPRSANFWALVYRLRPEQVAALNP